MIDTADIDSGYIPEEAQLEFDLRDLDSHAYALRIYNTHNSVNNLKKYEEDIVRQHISLLGNEKALKTQLPALIHIASNLVHCSRYDPDIANEAIRFCKDHLDQIQQYAEQPKNSSYTLLAVLSIYERIKDPRISDEFYSNLLRKGFNTHTFEYDSEGRYVADLQYLQYALLSGHDDIVQSATDVIHTSIEHDVKSGKYRTSNTSYLGELLESDDNKLYQIGIKIFYEEVNSLNPHSSADFLYRFRWLRSGEENREELFAYNNLVQMKRLEAKRPGSVHDLNQTFAIANFARYPLDLLVRQYDVLKRDEPMKDTHIFLAFAANDHNGAFSKNHIMNEYLTSRSDSMDAFVFEWCDSLELREMVEKSEAIFGAGDKLLFVVHGSDEALYSTESITGTIFPIDLASWNKDKGEYVPEKLAESIANLVKPNGEIIFDSCGTGAMTIGYRETKVSQEKLQGPSNPISRILSMVTHRRTLAPQQNSILSSVDDRFHFQTLKRENISVAVYEEGNLVEEYE